MSVFRKKRANGTLSENWYYKFVLNNKRYKGSTFRTDKKEALEYERKLKIELIDLLSKKDSPQSVKEKSLQNFQEKVIREIQGESLPLEDVWETFKKIAPAQMKKIPKQQGWEAKESYWRDFLCFVNEQYPKCETLRDISVPIAQEYGGLIKLSGKYQKKVNYKGRTYKKKATKLSPSSINKYIIHLRQIFRILTETAGLLENPFDKVQTVENQRKQRDVFSLNELEKIAKYLESQKTDSLNSKKDALNFIINQAIFVIGINTGLRKGDISLLKWGDINLEKNTLNREILKTGERVFIPMTRNLHNFLNQKASQKRNDYVTPELAEMYLNNSEGITYRFKKMLNHLDIQSQKEHTDRSIRTSNKDIHSLRHTFCYLHGVQGTPLIMVQSMVGHMDKKMTESYMMHKTEELKREAIEKFSMQSFLPGSSPLNDIKQNVIKEVQKCDSIDLLKEVLAMLQPRINMKF